MKVVCIDDSFKPNEIPNSCWVEKDKEYVVTKIKQLSNDMAFELEGFDLRPYFPFTGFSVKRFAILAEPKEIEGVKLEEIYE